MKSHNLIITTKICSDTEISDDLIAYIVSGMDTEIIKHCYEYEIEIFDIETTYNRGK